MSKIQKEIDVEVLKSRNRLNSFLCENVSLGINELTLLFNSLIITNTENQCGQRITHPKKIAEYLMSDKHIQCKLMWKCIGILSAGDPDALHYYNSAPYYPAIFYYYVKYSKNLHYDSNYLLDLHDRCDFFKYKIKLLRYNSNVAMSTVELIRVLDSISGPDIWVVFRTFLAMINNVDVEHLVSQLVIPLPNILNLRIISNRCAFIGILIFRRDVSYNISLNTLKRLLLFEADNFYESRTMKECVLFIVWANLRSRQLDTAVIQLLLCVSLFDSNPHCRKSALSLIFENRARYLDKCQYCSILNLDSVRSIELIELKIVHLKGLLPLDLLTDVVNSKLYDLPVSALTLIASLSFRLSIIPKIENYKNTNFLIYKMLSIIQAYRGGVCIRDMVDTLKEKCKPIETLLDHRDFDFYALTFLRLVQFQPCKFSDEIFILVKYNKNIEGLVDCINCIDDSAFVARVKQLFLKKTTKLLIFANARFLGTDELVYKKFIHIIESSNVLFRAYSIFALVNHSLPWKYILDGVSDFSVDGKGDTSSTLREACLNYMFKNNYRGFLGFMIRNLFDRSDHLRRTLFRRYVIEEMCPDPSYATLDCGIFVTALRKTYFDLIKSSDLSEEKIIIQAAFLNYNNLDEELLPNFIIGTMGWLKSGDHSIREYIWTYVLEHLADYFIYIFQNMQKMGRTSTLILHFILYCIKKDPTAMEHVDKHELICLLNTVKKNAIIPQNIRILEHIIGHLMGNPAFHSE